VFSWSLYFPKLCAESASTADDGMEMFEHICPKAGWCPRNVLDTVIELAIEIAREGREGRRIGTLFTLGFADSVLRNSRALILDPIATHPARN
jgi:diadenylate cyclase